MVTIILFGVYSAAVGIVVTLIEYFTNMSLDATRWFGWIFLPFMVMFIWMAMKQRKEEDYGGTISYGQCLGTGTLVGVVAGIVMAIFLYIYYNSINPALIDQMIQKGVADMKAKNLTSDQVEKAMPMIRMFTSPSMMGVIVLFGDIIIGLIISLIVGIFVRTKGEETAITV